MQDDIEATGSQNDQQLRIFKPTDLRDFEGWASDEAVCQRFLVDRPSTWRIAVQRYWRDRVTRRQLAAELGQGLETTKNLLRAIRKAAKDFQTGKPRRKIQIETQWPRRPHTEINVGDIFAICDGDPEAIAHAEEYRRLSTINQLSLFAPAISGRLVKLFEHTEKTSSAIVERLAARADELKGRSAKDDPFVGRAMFQNFVDHRTDYTDRRGRPRKETQPAPARKQPDLSDLRIVPVHRASFFGPPALNGISDATHKGNKRVYATLMDYKQAAEVIKEFNIPRSIVARLSGLHLPDLSAWLNGKQDISDDKRERVSQWVADVSKMIQAMGTLGIKVDLADVENVRYLVQKINDAEAQMDLFVALPEEPLRMKPIGTAAD